MDTGREQENDNDSDYTTDSEESSSEYCRGGYHPVFVGDMFKNKRYEVKEKVGYGAFSTVWKAYDHKQNREIALKITKSEEDVRVMTEDELEYCKRIGKAMEKLSMKTIQLTLINDSFLVKGPHGVHYGLTFDLCGSNLYSTIHKSYWEPNNTWIVRRIIRQLIEALAFLHDHCDMIHADIKPENILWESPLMNANNPELIQTMFHDHNNLELTKIKLADLNGAILKSDKSCDFLQTREYRAIEVTLGQKITTAIDIWSTGCTTFDLITGTTLFEPERSDKMTKTQHHASLIEKYCGRIPSHMRDRGTYVRDVFDGKKKPKFVRQERQTMSEHLIEISGCDDSNVAHFIEIQLSIDYRLRPTAEQLLNHPFLK